MEEEEISLKEIEELWSKIENKDECRKIIEGAIAIIVDGKLISKEAALAIDCYTNKISSKIPFTWRRNARKLLKYLDESRPRIEAMSEVIEILDLNRKDRKSSKNILSLLDRVEEHLDV